MRIYKVREGIVLEENDRFFLLNEEWDQFINRDDLYKYAQSRLSNDGSISFGSFQDQILAPIGLQEVWASGVTYYRSREARMDESKDAGGGDFYDKVYSAKRPELFFKSNAARVIGPGQNVRIREDSKWNVPEPELTLVISSQGKIIGYTIGNDMSSRDIEGENPLYLPQAKCYDGSAAIGPCILVQEEPLHLETVINLEIRRKGNLEVAGQTRVDQIKRKFEELVHYLFLETTFPHGAMLMTGTGIVPPNDFTLDHGDEILIQIEGIGTLVNYVA